VRKSIFSIIVAILLLSSCKDIPRDNPLDPQNPNSYQQNVILLEAFVNTNNPYNYNLWALQALDSIAETYGSHVVIAEYHRNTSQFTDPLADPLFELLYEKYVEHSAPVMKGVPDVFINGIGDRVQGASSVSSVISRLNTIISDLVILENQFTLQPGEVKINSSEIIASCMIARLGSQSSDNLLLKMILVQRINSQELKRVVREVEKSTTISRLVAGEIKTISFDPAQFSERPDEIIFSLTSSDELTVYQCIRVVL
jgi:hypothetical protein